MYITIKTIYIYIYKIYMHICLYWYICIYEGVYFWIDRCKLINHLQVCLDVYAYRLCCIYIHTCLFAPLCVYLIKSLCSYTYLLNFYIHISMILHPRTSELPTQSLIAMILYTGMCLYK